MLYIAWKRLFWKFACFVLFHPIEKCSLQSLVCFGSFFQNAGSQLCFRVLLIFVQPPNCQDFCQDCIFWTIESFVSKLDIVVHDHALEYQANRLFCYLQVSFSATFLLRFYTHINKKTQKRSENKGNIVTWSRGSHSVSPKGKGPGERVSLVPWTVTALQVTWLRCKDHCYLCKQVMQPQSVELHFILKKFVQSGTTVWAHLLPSGCSYSPAFFPKPLSSFFLC